MSCSIGTCLSARSGGSTSDWHVAKWMFSTLRCMRFYCSNRCHTLFCSIYSMEETVELMNFIIKFLLETRNYNLYILNGNLLGFGTDLLENEMLWNR